MILLLFSSSLTEQMEQGDMICGIIHQNPDDRLLKKACDFMSKGHIVAFPADTTWYLAASPLKKEGVKKLYKLRGLSSPEEGFRPFSFICDSISRAQKLAIISNYAFKKIRRVWPGPYTFIFPLAHTAPKEIRSYQKNKQIGIRIPDCIISKRLVETGEFPLIVASISTQILEDQLDMDIEEVNSYWIDQVYGDLVSMIFDPGELYFIGSSSIVDFSVEEEREKIIREGVGPLDLFIK